ncbi:MAG: hypothetical protein KGH59_02685 [Candidatus Micrarchaeota archaeon]|nr:hypothetical protein [Candidatus Micrarchaeota archaeon]MDE1846869.1 hypothetical protein [Candidatus Micrarchaeota archaeon]
MLGQTRVAPEVISGINLEWDRYRNVSDALLILHLAKDVPSLGKDLDEAWRSGRAPIPNAERIKSIRTRITKDPLSYYDGSGSAIISDLLSLRNIPQDSPAFDLALIYLHAPTKLQVAKAGLEAKLDASFKDLECIARS